MKSRPILFSAPMARALLAGTKTQTRRVANPQPQFMELQGSRHFLLPKQKSWAPCGALNWQRYAEHLCPYGKPGDRLWVRETLRAKDGFMVYAADDGRIDCDGLDWPACIEPRKTIVSIHMPRWASRLTLEITGVRVERLQSISEADAQAEGIERVGGEFSCTPWRNYRIGCPDEMKSHCAARSRSYMTLWESINGPGSWDANPWVWCISFKVV